MTDSVTTEPENIRRGIRSNMPDTLGAHGGGPTLVAENSGLQVHKIGKRFKKRPVLRDVSMHLNRGEVVGLLGPNGAGKTTCFYIVTAWVSVICRRKRRFSAG